MATRPHLAGIAEDGWNRALGGALRSRGWRHLVVPHTGYAGPDFVRVLARVVLAPHADDPVERADRFEYRRGWRNFLTAEALDVEVTVDVAGQRHRTRTDRSGHVDVRLPNPGLAPGWSDVTLTAPGSEPARVPVRVVAGDETFGLVSDIDDTVIRTLLPRPLIAAYNTFVVQEQSRRPVPGMASLYDAAAGRPPRRPHGLRLDRRVEHRADPVPLPGPARLPGGAAAADRLGPDQHRLVPQRSGRTSAPAWTSLVDDFPAIRWVLVGDDGQHDPEIYAGVRARPPRPRPRDRDTRADARPSRCSATASPPRRPTPRCPLGPGRPRPGRRLPRRRPPSAAECGVADYRGAAAG